MNAFIHWAEASGLYQDYFSKLPAPLDNVYFDALVVGALGIYLAYCVVSDIVDWAWIGRVGREGRREKKARSVKTAGVGDKAVTAFSVEAQEDTAVAAFSAEAQENTVVAEFSAKAQDVTAGADVRPAAPADAVAAPQSVKSRMSQIWVKQREIEGLRKEIGTPGKLSREEALAALARIAEVKEEIERIKWEMCPPGDNGTGINSTEEKAEAAEISEDAKGKNGPVNILGKAVNNEESDSLEKGEAKKECVSTFGKGESQNGCASTLDSRIAGQCPDVDEAVPADGPSEFDRLMEQYEATQKAIGLLEEEGLVEKSEGPAGRRGDRESLDGHGVADNAAEAEDKERSIDTIAIEMQAAVKPENDSPAGMVTISLRTCDLEGAGMETVPTQVDELKGQRINQAFIEAGIPAAEEKKERQKAAGKLTDQEVTEVLLRGLSCIEAAEIANLEENLRIAAVRAALEAGASTRQVARLTGISKSTVQRIGAL